jgi:hypothetical protein
MVDRLLGGLVVSVSSDLEFRFRFFFLMAEAGILTTLLDPDAGFLRRLTEEDTPKNLFKSMSSVDLLRSTSRLSGADRPVREDPGVRGLLRCDDMGPLDLLRGTPRDVRGGRVGVRPPEGSTRRSRSLGELRSLLLVVFSGGISVRSLPLCCGEVTTVRSCCALPFD